MIQLQRGFVRHLFDHGHILRMARAKYSASITSRSQFKDRYRNESSKFLNRSSAYVRYCSSRLQMSTSLPSHQSPVQPQKKSFTILLAATWTRPGRPPRFPSRGRHLRWLAPRASNPRGVQVQVGQGARLWVTWNLQVFGLLLIQVIIIMMILFIIYSKFRPPCVPDREPNLLIGILSLRPRRSQ